MPLRYHMLRTRGHAARQPVNRRVLIKDLGPKFEAVSLEDMSDAITRNCEALGRKLDKREKQKRIFRAHALALEAAMRDAALRVASPGRSSHGYRRAVS